MHCGMCSKVRTRSSKCLFFQNVQPSIEMVPLHLYSSTPHEMWLVIASMKLAVEQRYL